METRPIQLRMTVYSALFAALIAAGAFIAIPIGPVPIVLQNFFVLLVGLTLSWRWSLGSVAVYLLAGIVGLPVFSAGRGGIGHLLGPTGGYLVSYIPAVLLVGWFSDLTQKHLSESRLKKIVAEFIILVVAALIVYLIGVSWLKTLTGMSWQKSIAVGMLPFLPGDLIKIIVAIPVAGYLRTRLRKQ